MVKRILFPLRQLYLKRKWVKDIDFIFAIDKRALRQYVGFISKPTNVFLFPYYEDSLVADSPKKVEGKKMTFLFSGRLQKRNNIRNFAKAVDYLLEKYPGKFKVVISASGVEQKFLDRITEKHCNKAIIEYDRVFEKWEDRLRPFLNSHVLILPSLYSGWGLVVNEALSLGLPVISTRNVGCANYFIDHMINGILINYGWKDIFNAMEYFVLFPEEVERMSKQAIKINDRYSIETASVILYDIFVHLLKNR